MLTAEGFDLRTRIDDVLRPYCAKVTEIGPNSVGVQGDGRVFCPVAIVEFPRYMSTEQMGKLATKIMNEVPGVSRVLAHVHPPLFQKPIEWDERSTRPLPLWIERLFDRLDRYRTQIRSIRLVDPKLLRA